MTLHIDHIAIPAFVLDKNRVITHWNKALVHLTGLPSEKMLGTQNQWWPFYAQSRPTMADLVVQGKAQDRVDQLYSDKYHPCDVIEGAFAAEDFFPDVGEAGEWLAFTASPLHDQDGNPSGAIETLLNISTRKRTELELLQSEQRYRELSITDELTGLYNSRFLFQELERELERCRRYQQSLSLCMFDLDHFKLINDNQGHPFGNQVLAGVGKLISRHLRSTDKGFRFGGEEFIALMPAAGDALSPAERIRTALEKMCFSTAEGLQVQVTVSVGIACYIQGDDANSLLQRADQAMYRSKEAGRNRVTCILT
ncbi:MAG: diguanylate cyclase (GGDEF)-like protein [Motiliproteus sp.]|jgi:diguanylate cyclase (GGDEF)-like protein